MDAATLPIHVTHHASVDDLPEWDDVRPTTMYTASWRLRDAEDIYRDATRPTYVAVRAGNRMLAGTACWTVPRPGIVLPPLAPDRVFAHWQADGLKLIKTIRSPLPESDLYPFTVLGSPRGYAGRLHLCPDLDAASRRAALVHLIEAAEDVARRDGSKLVLLPYLDADDTRAAIAACPRLVVGFGLSDGELSPVPSFDDYLASLTRDRRSMIQEIRRFEAEGLRIEVKPLSQVVERASDLALTSRAKHEWTAAAEYDREALRIAAARRDVNTRVFCAMRGDAVVGIMYCVLDQHAYYPLVFGIDREQGRRGAPYFNLAYYAPIRHAAIDAVSYIHYGGGALDAKYRRGCRLQPRWNLVLPLTSWAPATTALVRECGQSMLAADRAIIAGCKPREPVDQVLGLADAGDLLGAATEPQAESAVSLRNRR